MKMVLEAAINGRVDASVTALLSAEIKAALGASM